MDGGLSIHYIMGMNILVGIHLFSTENISESFLHSIYKTFSHCRYDSIFFTFSDHNNRKVIRSIKHVDMGIHGDQITWDGRNERGQLVGSGVYLLSVYGQDGLNAVAKITVIRK